jgi:hypothetical protein
MYHPRQGIACPKRFLTNINPPDSQVNSKNCKYFKLSVIDGSKPDCDKETFHPDGWTNIAYYA